jgi:hypothetical protein
VQITDGAIVAAANLADRYVSDRFLPDKAIDLIDEAGARLRLSILSSPPELREFDEKIANVRQQKEQASEDQDFEKAASLRDEEKSLLAERLRLEKQWKSGDVATHAVVDEGLIAEVLAQATGIPVFKLTEEESSRLVFMEKALHQRVIGQEEAIAALAKTIRRQRAGLKDPKRPERLVHLRRPDRRRKDRARQGARGVPLRRRGRADLARHVGVRREAHRVTAVRCPSGIRRASKRAVSSPRRCAASRSASCCSTRSRRRTPTSSTRSCRSSKRAVSPTVRAA